MVVLAGRGGGGGAGGSCGYGGGGGGDGGGLGVVVECYIYALTIIDGDPEARPFKSLPKIMTFLGAILTFLKLPLNVVICIQGKPSAPQRLFCLSCIFPE